MDVAVPFNRPFVTGREFGYIEEAISLGHLSGGGEFTSRCQEKLTEMVGASAALLTHSGTGALEMAALLSGVRPGDEVILPSFTFVTTASAFTMRGAVPVFVDIEEQTMCLDLKKVEEAITPRTKVVVAVHYAGRSCDMNKLMHLARKHSLFVVEDAAQALGSSFAGKPLGSFGDVSCFSFHETKNVSAGEGGALLVNRPDLVDKARIIWEKGTNRFGFLSGIEDKYTWLEQGSSFQPSELVAAFLYAQLEEFPSLLARRLALWRTYAEALGTYSGRVTLPGEFVGGSHNGHIFSLRFTTRTDRDWFIDSLAEKGIMAVFHYVPLHSSPAGRLFGRTAEPELEVTNRVADTLVRLPLWFGMEKLQQWVIESVRETMDGISTSRE